MALRNWLRLTRANARPHNARMPRVRLGVLPLEGRDVPAVGLASALGLGSTAGASMANDVAADAAGNSYLTGHFYGTVDFDPTRTHSGDADILTSAGEKDVYVAKYAPDGSLIWAVRMGSASTERGEEGRAIDVDAAGNVYVAGQFRATGDYGPFTLTPAGNGKDAWVAKLNSAGTVLWANRWGRAEAGDFDGEIPQGLDLDAAGNVYVISTLFAAQGGYDILKYSTNGALQWAKSIASNMSGSSDVVADAAGNVFAVGGFDGTVDFDPNQPQKLVSDGPGAYSGFVLMLTTAGKFGWVSPFVSQSQLVNGTWTYGYSYAQAITLGPDGSVIVGGWYSNKVDFNPGSSTTNLSMGGGGFLAKLTGTGALTWAKALERDATIPSSAYVYGLATDASGNIYATGSFYGTVDFNPGAGVATRTSAGSSDTYVLKLTSAGNFAWAETFGGTGSDTGFGIAVDPSGVVHVAGYFSATVDFDPDPLANFDLTAPGTFTSSFLLRLRQN